MEKITLTDLQEALETSWSKKTSSTPLVWTPQNPTFGQCAVTTLIVQDYFGGNLIRAEVNEPGCSSHYWNQLPDGTEIDLTKDQFSKDFYEYIKKYSPKETRTREYVLSYPATVKRYKLLKQRVEEYLERRGEKK